MFFQRLSFYWCSFNYVILVCPLLLQWFDGMTEWLAPPELYLDELSPNIHNGDITGCKCEFICNFETLRYFWIETWIWIKTNNNQWTKIWIKWIYIFKRRLKLNQNQNQTKIELLVPFQFVFRANCKICSMIGTSFEMNYPEIVSMHLLTFFSTQNLSKHLQETVRALFALTAYFPLKNHFVFNRLSPHPLKSWIAAWLRLESALCSHNSFVINWTV